MVCRGLLPEIGSRGSGLPELDAAHEDRTLYAPAMAAGITTRVVALLVPSESKKPPSVSLA